VIMATIDGRVAVRVGDRFIDLADASNGRFGPDPNTLVCDWSALRYWVASTQLSMHPARTGHIDAPIPWPRQVFGIGINYSDHAAEAGLALADRPMVFPKFPSCISSPEDDLPMLCDTMDWEVELVVVVGAACQDVSVSEAWSFVAGLTIGQDITDRELQFQEPHPPQFGLAKSRPGFGPIGPWIVTPDELDEPDDLRIRCFLNGELVQEARTRDLVFGVPELLSYLSSRTRLGPGDLIFTGTPAGVGMTREPPRYLRPGDQLTSVVDGIGEFTTNIVDRPLARQQEVTQ
jgi:2,4-didehydro-3-deoxy-L-rhamnonate hydrolase